MQKLNLSSKGEAASSLPIRAIQFGTGNFIRCFIDWMIYKTNEQGLFNGRVLALQCTPHGNSVPKLKEQDCLFTTVLNSYVDGKACQEIDLVNAIADVKNPYDEWESVLCAATDENVQFIFSNTTEAGITFSEESPFNTDVCPQSFPGKLTAMLFERFKALKGNAKAGLWIVPCELIEDNGLELKRIVLKHVDEQNLGDEFKAYVNEQCRFLNTLVDRVVSGFPYAEKEQYYEKLGYEDKLISCGEKFHFLAIEGGADVAEALPFAKAGLNVVVADDITPYRVRKVRILNGAHTANVPAAVLSLLETVDEMMANEVTGKFARSVIYDEIIPSLKLDKDMLVKFADDVVARFSDPALHHQLTDILMNCTSKINARVIPTILDARAKGVLPMKLCFALAAYIALYKNATEVPVVVQLSNGKTKEFYDDAYAVDVISSAWTHYRKNEASAVFVVQAVLSDSKLWGCNLSSDIDLVVITSRLLHAIISDGAMATMRDLLEHY